MCSSVSPSMTVPRSNSIGHASLPGCSTTAWPPSWNAPSSKLVRVRIEGLKNSSAIDLPFKSSPSFSFLNCAALVSSASSSARLQSCVLKKCRIVIRKPQSKNQKPGAGPGFIVESHENRATAYPAVLVVAGRRAREVMPAAMSALDRISKLAKSWFMGTQSFGWPIMHGILSRCNRKSARSLSEHPARRRQVAVVGFRLDVQQEGQQRIDVDVVEFGHDQPALERRSARDEQRAHVRISVVVAVLAAAMAGVGAVEIRLCLQLPAVLRSADDRGDARIRAVVHARGNLAFAPTLDVFARGEQRLFHFGFETRLRVDPGQHAGGDEIDVLEIDEPVEDHAAFVHDLGHAVIGDDDEIDLLVQASFLQLVDETADGRVGGAQRLVHLGRVRTVVVALVIDLVEIESQKA